MSRAVIRSLNGRPCHSSLWQQYVRVMRSHLGQKGDEDVGNPSASVSTRANLCGCNFGLPGNYVHTCVHAVYQEFPEAAKSKLISYLATTAGGGCFLQLLMGFGNRCFQRLLLFFGDSQRLGTFLVDN